MDIHDTQVKLSGRTQSHQQAKCTSLTALA